MLEQGRRRSASLMREDARDWPDSASVMAETMAPAPGDSSHGNSAPAPTKSNGGQTHRPGSNRQQQVQASRKTDLEKLYWTLNGDQASARFAGNEKIDSNGFHHSATAAFDEVDKSLWNGKMANGKPEPTRRSRSGSWAHTQTGYRQQQQQRALQRQQQQQRALQQQQQQQQRALQQQLEEGAIEKFYWNDHLVSHQR